MALNNNSIPEPNLENASLISSTISIILERYNLKETSEEETKKIFEYHVNTNGDIVFWVASMLINNEKNESDLESILTKDLNVNNQIAKQIINDIKKELLPIIKKPETLSTPNIKKIETDITPDINATPSKRTIPKKESLPKSKMMPENNKTKSTKSNLDKYREPFE
jgi:hypothetical protein